MVERLKRVIASFYTDTCNVYETMVEAGDFTRFEKIKRYENIPCRISAKNYLFGESAGSKNSDTLKISKRVKIFLPPEYEVLPGSMLEISHLGKNVVYGKSGEMTFYPSHNEVMVEIVKDYA